MNRKIALVISLLLGFATKALAETCPSASRSTTITSSCSTGINWTSGNLTLGNGSAISITNTNLDDVFVIKANGGSLGALSNKANSTIGSINSGNGIQNDVNSIMRRLYNYGAIIAENGVWNDGTISALYNYGSISSTNGGIWNNAGSINNIHNIGSITVGGGANGVYNNGFISILNNKGSVTVGNIGTAIFNGGNGVITTLNNSGAINVGSAGGGGSWGISNGGVISNLNNSGSISLLDDGYGIANSNLITTLNNSGSLEVASGNGIWNTGGTITTLNNSGTINTGGGDILNDGTIITLNNSGLLTGSNVGVNNIGTLTTFNNINSINITSDDSGVGVANSGTFTTFNNLGSIIVAGTNASAISNSGNFNALNNYGVMTVGDGVSYNIYNSGSIATINNSGSISTGTDGVGIYNDGIGAISTLTNTGSITAGTDGVGIRNEGNITTLNNSQGGDSSLNATTALSYTGNSPTNYNIGIVSNTHYGQLLTDPNIIIANVGIYGNPLLTSRTYASVLSNDVTVTNLQNKYDNLTVSLVNNIDTGKWDLAFSGVSLMGTQRSLINNANALIPIYTLQNTVLVNSFTYDCNLFNENNICISAGGRNINTSSVNGLDNSSALLIAAYRLNKNYRIGAYVDQNLSIQNIGNAINLDNNIPLLGFFAAWSERSNGTGAEVKISAAYGQKNATITRQIVGLSESGSGSSTLNSQGAQVTAKYGFGITKNIIVAPYIGMRHTQNNMGGYTENASSLVTAPLTYKALNTNATTALAGVGGSYHFIPKAAIFANVGVETDINTNNGTYSASGIAGLNSVKFNSNPVKTRPTASLGGYYDLGKNQHVGIVGIHRQEPFRKLSNDSVMVTYTIGM